MSTFQIDTMSGDLFHLLLDLNRKVFNPHSSLKGMSIPVSHIKVIIHLTELGPLPVSVLAKHLDISRPNMTPIIDKLIDEGLLVRHTDPNDRRIIVITHTDKALEFLAELKQHIILSLTDKFKVLDEPTLSQFHEAILTITKIITRIQ